VLLGVGVVRAHGEGGERVEVFLRLVLLEARLGVVQPHEVLEKRAAAGDEPRALTELADTLIKFWTCVELHSKEPRMALASMASVATSHSA